MEEVAKVIFLFLGVISVGSAIFMYLEAEEEVTMRKDFLNLMESVKVRLNNTDMYERLLALELPGELPEDRRERVKSVVRFLFAFMLEHRDHVRLLQRHLLERDALPQLVSERYTAALLARAAQLLVALDLGPVQESRLVLLDMNHLISRYVLSDPADLALFVEGPDVMEGVAEHLAQVAVTLLVDSPD